MNLIINGNSCLPRFLDIRWLDERHLKVGTINRMVNPIQLYVSLSYRTRSSLRFTVQCLDLFCPSLLGEWCYGQVHSHVSPTSCRLGSPNTVKSGFSTRYRPWVTSTRVSNKTETHRTVTESRRGVSGRDDTVRQIDMIERNTGPDTELKG